MKPELIKSNIKLTIGILVSNRIDTIRQCMESLRPLLAAIPSELIAVDTVGEETDGSIDIVREYTDKIYRFVWCNDFSAARNVCIDHAKGEWFLYLDDDEWFDDVHELIEFFKSGEYEKYYSGYYYVKNYSADGSTTMAIVGRMVRRTINTRFVGKVHESFNEVFSPKKQFSCFVHHNGYVFSDENAKKKHQERNMSILREELKVKGYTPKICAQIVQELLYLKETRKEGGQFCKESIEHLEKKGEMKDSCSQWLLLASVRFYSSEEEYEKAIGQAEKVCSQYEVTQMARLGIAWVAVYSSAVTRNYPAIEKWVPIYVECYEWLKENPEEALVQTNLDMPKYYSEKSLAEMLQAGIAVANMNQQFEQALEYFKKFPWKGEEGREEQVDGSKYKEDLLFTLRGLKDKSYLISYYRKFYKEEWFLPENVDYLPRECREAMGYKVAPVLSVSLLVSNRKDTVRKCMESLKPLLTAVPSELIVVDTVGEENSDGSLGIAREYTDNVVHFDWCNDFSAARNVGLKRAKGEWFLFLDDDEWFEDVTPIIRFFIEGDYKQYDGAWYKVRNYENLGGTEYTDNFADRMRKINPELHFEGKIHEKLLPQPTNVMQFFCYVHHYGYVYNSQEEKKNHEARNIMLLEQELREQPDDLRMILQLIREYDAAERPEEAETLCRQSLERYASMPENPYIQNIIAMLFRVIARQLDQEAAASKLEDLGGMYSLSKIVKLVYLTVGSIVEMQCGNYAKVLQTVSEWLELKEQISGSKEEDTVQMISDLQSFLSPEYEQEILVRGIHALIEAEEYSNAERMLERISWSDEEHKPFEEMILLTKLYGKSGRPELFFPYAERIMKNLQMKESFLVALQDMIREYPERREELSEWLRKFEPKQKKAVNPELAKLAEQLKRNIRKLIAAGNKTEARELIAGLKELMPEDEETAKLESSIY